MENSSAPTMHQPVTSGTIQAFRIWGVPVRLHFTFVLLLVFLLVTDLGRVSSGAYALFLLGLFASVLLHEMAHAAVGLRFGVRTVEIVMFPIGGISRLERSLKPKEELWISLAGPFMNLVLAGGLFGLAVATHQVFPTKFSDLINDLAQPSEAVVARLGFANLLLALFNLLPAFPMDGGRALRALLTYIRPEAEATRIAAWMGRVLAISMGLYGLLAPQFMLVFVAFFVWLGAAQESTAALGRTLTQGIPVRAAMITEFHTLEHGDTVRDAANLLLSTSQQDFPIMHAGQLVGLLDRNVLLKSLAQEGPDAYVAGVMDRDYLVLKPTQDLSEILPLMAQAGRCAMVMEGERLLGLLTTDNLAEFLLLRRFGMEPVV
ncbi:MAG TPA: site-2 protease family protein [Bryobacteraceae bacterium]|nr:site-2 protease family protein [Bryobacteraceae bacterium]